MNCPYCGGEMRHGEITTDTTIIRWVEGQEPKSKFWKFHAPRTAGKLLQIPHFAWKPWIPADFCPKCKKMIFETDIIDG